MSMSPEQLAKSGSEHGHQVAVFVWVRANVRKEPLLDWLFAIPNGGQRNAATAGRLKAEGVKSGVPDLMLPVPRKNYAGLFIEMKKLDGKLDKNQKDVWIPFLTGQHYYVGVCYGWEQAVDCLKWYLELEGTEWR